MNTPLKTLKLFGGNVRSLRVQLGITQEKLAESAGLHPTYISGIERGIRNPTLLSIINLADALDVSISALLRGV
jgi:transcriptional regulator with XRE-family HTH domain